MNVTLVGGRGRFNSCFVKKLEGLGFVVRHRIDSDNSKIAEVSLSGVEAVLIMKDKCQTGLVRAAEHKAALSGIPVYTVNSSFTETQALLARAGALPGQIAAQIEKESEAEGLRKRLQETGEWIKVLESELDTQAQDPALADTTRQLDEANALNAELWTSIAEIKAQRGADGVVLKGHVRLAQKETAQARESLAAAEAVIKKREAACRASKEKLRAKDLEISREEDALRSRVSELEKELAKRPSAPPASRGEIRAALIKGIKIGKTGGDVLDVLELLELL